ncbi:MAG TPA: GGDEF domain-containing protein [Candidatus Limiplasma sp.]|nr:GGDEF domain-containing protein [Candidatus Limiplasma sp.]HRX08381.1 GGDEF domain-containing protein [Candidatus Limiplasma sp.]
MENITRFLSVFENLYEGVYYVDINRQILFWNAGAERITGFTRQEVLNRHCYDNILMHTDDKGTHICIKGCPLHQSMADNEIKTAFVYLQHKSGYRVPVSVRAIPILNQGVVCGAIEVFQIQQELLETMHNVEELKLLALTDQLTVLPNRRYITTFLESKIRENRALGINFGVLFIDIDHFKALNDQHGHTAGDEVLSVLSKTFANVLRASDRIGRWGGEEFLGVCICRDGDTLLKIAEKIRTLAEKTVIPFGDLILHITISIGATMIRENDTLGTLIQRADKLMYKSKANGRNQTTLK